MKNTNLHNLHEVWEQACNKDTYSGSDKKGYSVTQLWKYPKEIILENRHFDELTVDVKDKTEAVLGTALHQILEDAITPKSVFNMRKLFNSMVIDTVRYRKKSFEIAIEDFKEKVNTKQLLNALIGDTSDSKYITERRFSTEYKGIDISGGVDLIDKSKSLIVDFKTANVYKYINQSDMDKWMYQLNAYRYLVEKELGIKIKRLQITIVMRDWKRSQYELEKMKCGGCEPKYPSEAVRTINIPVRDYSFTLDMWAAKLSALSVFNKYEDDDIPMCPDRWSTDTKYRLMKDGRKSALILAKSMPELNKRKTQEIKKLVKKRIDKMKVAPSLPIVDSIEDEEREKFNKITHVSVEYGIEKKCEWYCPIKDKCNHYRDIMKKKEE